MLPRLFHKKEEKYPATIILRWLWQTSRGNRRQALLNVILGLADVAVSLGSVWAIQRAIDTAAGTRQGSLWMAVGVMAALIACEFAISIGRVWVKNILGIRAQNRMQWRMMDRLLSSEWRGREKDNSCLFYTFPSPRDAA